MPIRVEHCHQVASGAAGRVGEAALPCLLERGEPTEEHLSGVEYGGGLRRADHSAADRTRGQLNLDFPTCGALGTGGELGTSQAPGGGVQSRDDVTRGLRIRRLPAPAAEIGVPRSEEHTSELQSLTNLVCRLL